MNTPIMRHSALRAQLRPLLRFDAALHNDVRLQARNGFYYAAGFVLLALLAVFTRLPVLDFKPILAGLVFGNLPITTFFFMAGVLMLEKAEGVLEATIVSPLRWNEYLAAKVVSLTGLALVEGLLLAAIYSRMDFSPLPLSLGLLAAGALLALAGFICVARYASVNAFLMPSVAYLFALQLPLLGYFDLLPGALAYLRPLLYLHPLQPALTLLAGGFAPLGAAGWLYGLGGSLLWLALTAWLARRTFVRYIIMNPGGR